jgi:hypothetical protein
MIYEIEYPALAYLMNLAMTIIGIIIVAVGVALLYKAIWKE